MATLTLDTTQGSLLDALEKPPARRRPDRPAPARGAAPAPASRTLDDRSAPGERAAAAAPSRRTLDDRSAPGERAATAAPSGRTLDDLVAGAWSALSVTQTAACPLCGGDVVPRFGAGPQPVAGACRSCGTELS